MTALKLPNVKDEDQKLMENSGITYHPVITLAYFLKRMFRHCLVKKKLKLLM